MRLVYGIVLGFVLCLGVVSAAFNLEIDVVDKGGVVISELDNSAVYDLIIKNNDGDDVAEIYSLAGLNIIPKSNFELPLGTSKVEIKASLSEDLRKRDGTYSIEYQIKGQQNGIYKGKLPIRVVFLKEVFIINPKNIHPDNDFAEIIVKNRVNSNLENVKVNLKSVFFNYDGEVSLKPYEAVNVSVKIDRSKTSRLIAGPYVVNSVIGVGEEKVELEGIVNYLEKEGISVMEESDGFLIRENRITKKNEGNIPVNAKIEMKKDIILRLFTTYSIDPLTSKRGGVFVNYNWEKNIGPGESFVVVSKTNYTFPFIFVILVVFIVLLVKYYSSGVLSLNKKVSLVKTKGGEFALKVRIRIKAKKDIGNIKIVDRLPGMTKLYKGHGRAPDEVNESSRSLSWNITGLNSGEERVVSYIIYSKVRAVGRFELPFANAIFEYNGKRENVSSNSAYFVSETAGED